MNASPFGSQSVIETPEIARVAALPRRVWSSEDSARLAAMMTAELKTPGGTKTLRPVQGVALYEAMESRGLFGPIRVGGGKCLGRGTPVLMFDGSIKKVEQVEVGDVLMGPDSGPRYVKSVCAGREALYRIVPVKGEPYVVNESHILSLKQTRQSVRHPAPCMQGGRVCNLAVREFLGKSERFRANWKGYRVGVEFPARAEPPEPYMLGVWLGDGCSNAFGITTADAEIVSEIRDFATRHSLKIRVSAQEGNAAYTYYLSNGPEAARKKKRNIAVEWLAFEDVLNNKHVPHDYKTGSRLVRLEVLAGLLDSDGHLGHVGYDYVSVSERLADDVCFLARSLGLAAYKRQTRKECVNNGVWGTYYRVSISGDVSCIPCRIVRKKAPPRRQKKSVLMTGIRAEPIGEGDYFGFELEGVDRLFLLGDFTVTHNTLLTLLLPAVLEAKRPALLLPAALVEKTWRDFHELREHWRLPTNIQIISYEMLGLVQSATKLEYILPDLIMADECFVAGTPIRTAKGVRPIESICVGDLVETGEGLRRVTGAGSRESEDLYDVEVGESRYTCTGDHPFLTIKGWRAARDLAVGDEVVRDVSTAVRFEALSEETILQSRVQVREPDDSREVVREREGSEDRRRPLLDESGIGADEDQEPDAFAGSAGGDSALASRAGGLATTCAGRQRSPNAGAATEASGSARAGVVAREALPVGSERDTGIPCGHGSRGQQDRGGGGRTEPSRREGQEEGRQEGCLLGRERLARVASVQRRGSGAPGSCARVYNLSVEGPETYVLGGGEIVHNCHYLKNYRAGRTRRVLRYMREHPETLFAGVSGTVMKSSIRDFAHILRWSLKSGAPIPETDDETAAWADALDEKVNPLARRQPGALLSLDPTVAPPEPPMLAGGVVDVMRMSRMTTTLARRVFQERLLQTRGVVASSKSDGVTCSLQIGALEYKAGDITAQHFTHVRKTKTTPDGWGIAEPMLIRMYLRQLALGFHGVWEPRPPQPWLDARREWAAFVREVLEDSDHLDTELQVANEVDAGRLRTPTLAAWRRVRDSFQIEPKDIWHDDAALQACAKWMEAERGIVWCEHRFFARRLAALTGAVYYGANGLAEGSGESITLVKPGRAIIASIQANATGRNLQMFSTNLVTSCQ
ncbi:MAG TPA: Hint domain-containing homing endonuclease, partial [Polyangiaceae bacterium]|nr:Hint domain-containing homing endonuclease [Polyangiaceae bacterium]